jgi:type IV pilus assembly protein PilY1
MLHTNSLKARLPRWLAKCLGLALVFGVVATAFGFDEVPYPLTVIKKAFNDAGTGATTVSGSPVSSFSGTDYGNTNPANNKIVTYAISYGQSATGADPSTLGALTFDDSLSASMHMVGAPAVPTSWSSTTSGTATVSYTSPLMIPGSNSSRSPATPAVLATGSGGGDGFAPIIYTSPDGQTKRFFEIYHHQSAGYINCQNFSDGVACPGYPKALLNGASGVGTAMWVHTVIVGTRIYYPMNDGDKSVGIGCFDASTDSNCAYISLATKVTGNYSDQSSGNASVTGVMQVPGQPNKLYLAQWGYLYCWNLTTSATCGAKTQILTSAGHFDSTKDQGHADLMVAGTAAAPNTMLFALQNGWLSCWNVANWPATTCAAGKWPVQVTSMTSRDHNILSQYLDTSGNVIGTCATVDSGWETFTPVTKCYDTSATVLTTPAILTGSAYGNYFYVSTSTQFGTKVYYPLPADATKPGPVNKSLGATACWDFATSTACSGFTDAGAGAITGIRRWRYNNAGSTTKGAVGETRDYAYTRDGNCLFGLGDSAALWSFDPGTGAAPCVSASDDVTVPDPKAFCDGQDHLSSWDRVQFNNTPTAIASVVVKVYDAASCPFPTKTSTCTPLSTGDPVSSLLPQTPTWTIRFSPAVSLKTYPSIRVTYDYTFVDATPPTSYTGFSVSTLYSPDATSGDTKGAIGQVCMRAQVNNCPAAFIDNLAIIKRASNGNVLGRGLWTISTDMANPSYTDTAPAISDAAVSGTADLSGRLLFRTSYQVTDWSGDLTAYQTDTAGNPTDTKAWVASDGVSGASAAQMLPAAASRNILTTTGTGAVGSVTGLSFDVTSMTASQSSATMALFGSSSSDQISLINYLRGDRSLEAKSGTNNPFRRRMLWDATGSVTALGDFIHSKPVYNNGMVYAEANDGMLHAFNASTGVESFAFIPSSVFSLLKPTSEVRYAHSWIMDGQVALAKLSSGKTLVVGSTGGTMPAIFGIDVSGLPSTAPGPTAVKFETTSTALGRANGDIQIVTLPDSGGTQVALLGNGMGSASNLAQLIQVNLSTGAITAYSTGTGSSSTPNGLSAPTPLIVAGKLVAVYAGDALGNLWRFPMTSAGAIDTPVKLFTTQANQPITGAPTVSGQLTLNSQTGYYVYFGTGKSVDRTDTAYDPTSTAEQATQSLYGVFDVVSGGKPNSSGITLASLVAQTLDSVTGAVTNNAVDLSKKSGWYLNLQAGNTTTNDGAERILSAPVYNADNRSITVVTAIPHKSGCMNANVKSSHAIHVSATTGGTASSSKIIGASSSEITLTGTLGGIALATGTNMLNNYTSDAGGGDAILNPSVHTGGGASEFNTQGVVKPMKRTSWTQLY